MDTISLWLGAWSQSNKYGCSIAVIHNYDGNNPPATQIYNIERFRPDFYIKRKNIGMDIGAFQMMIGFKWDILYWFTDDMLPMRKNFLEPFREKILQKDVGLVGHNYSPSNIRTVAFAIKKEVATRLIFPANPITTRQQCLQFEHGNNHLTKQVIDMGYKVKAVHGGEPNMDGYRGSGEELYADWMWDWHYYPELNLWNKFESEFGSRSNYILKEKML